MPVLFADRAQDTSTTTGTGNFTLANSAPTGFQTLNAAFGTGVSLYYAIVGGAEWEVGKGSLSTSTVLLRTTILASSNAGAAVNFSAGTKDVFCTIAASVIATLDDAQTFTQKTLTSPVINTPTGIVKGDVGLGSVDNTSDAGKPVSTAQQTALNLKENTANKDVSGGYVGKTLEKINFWNTARTFISFFVNAATAARTYTFPDKDGTVAMLVDITGTNSGTNTGDNATNTQYSGLVSNATHTGDATGATALTIAANAVTNAKAAQMATKTYKGRTSAATGNSEDVAVATLKTDLVLVKADVGLGNVDNTSDVTERAATATLTNKTIALGSNTVSGTKAQFDTAVTDADLGYLGSPQNSQSAAYTLVIGDADKTIYHPSADNNARTFTIPANASVAFPVGTTIIFINKINVVTIAITTDTMTLANAGTTGSRTLAANNWATAIKITSTEWLISGTAGLA